MNLDEAIDRYANNAEYERTHGNLQGYLEFKQLAEWLKDYKRLLEQQPTTTTNNNEPITVIYPTIVCDDAISRDAVLKKIDYEVEHYCKYLEEVDDKRNVQTHVALVSDNIREEVEQLPPVTPQNHGKMLICPSCGLDVHSDFKYCPRCGAKMQESEERE